jgi:hypothetical protein
MEVFMEKSLDLRIEMADRDRPPTLPRVPRARLLILSALCLGPWCRARVPPCSPHPASAPSALAFRIDEGHELNAFLRDGELAAHLVVRSGTEPRILVAFPAGDSGVALWFARTPHPITWSLVGSPRAVLLTDSRGRLLHGIEAELTADAPLLQIRQAALSSVRVIRNFEHTGRLPPEVRVSPVAIGNKLTWARDRLDGAPGYRLEVVRALEDARALHLIVRAFSGDPPLEALAPHELLRSTAARDTRERDVLEFLSYREKFLAGSWRFDTYFGRDTLVSLALLAPVLEPQALESGLRSVLRRLAPDGEVAHEEAIGEFAILENIAAGRGMSAAPVYDYSMIDESFMLAPVAAQWLLDEPAGRARAALFLASHAGGAGRAGDALARNLAWVVTRAAPFAARPRFTNLIGIKEGEDAGDWRDSKNGLGGGRYPYDVNAVWVPVALRAAARLVRSGLLDRYLTLAERRTLVAARAEHGAWVRYAPPLFLVRRSESVARAQVARYASVLHIDGSPGLAALRNRPIAFDALSLDASGRQVPVMQSDIGFALLLERPAAQDLERMLDTAARPFPAGLLTPVGLLVANPVFAVPAMQTLFTSHDYHGTVIWSWQEALLAAGIDHQLARTDLDARVRQMLESLRKRLSAAIEDTRSLRAAELWTWAFENGRYRTLPFEPQSGAATESDAAQLWSTTFLGIPSQ